MDGSGIISFEALKEQLDRNPGLLDNLTVRSVGDNKVVDFVSACREYEHQFSSGVEIFAITSLAGRAWRT